MAKGFIRGDIGGRLQKAQNQTLSDSARRFFKESGVSYEPSPVRSTIGQVRLTVQEQADYQEEMNRNSKIALDWLAKHPGWAEATPDQRETKVKQLFDQARELATEKMKKQIGVEEGARRVERDRSRAGVR